MTYLPPLDGLDVDGAVRAAAEKVDDCDMRAAFLRKAGVGAGAVMGSGVLLGGLPAMASAATLKSDVDSLNFALRSSAGRRRGRLRRRLRLPRAARRAVERATPGRPQEAGDAGRDRAVRHVAQDQRLRRLRNRAARRPLAVLELRGARARSWAPPRDRRSRHVRRGAVRRRDRLRLLRRAARGRAVPDRLRLQPLRHRGPRELLLLVRARGDRLGRDRLRAAGDRARARAARGAELRRPPPQPAYGVRRDGGPGRRAARRRPGHDRAGDGSADGPFRGVDLAVGSVLERRLEPAGAAGQHQRGPPAGGPLRAQSCEASSRLRERGSRSTCRSPGGSGRR